MKGLLFVESRDGEKWFAANPHTAPPAPLTLHLLFLNRCASGLRFDSKSLDLLCNHGKFFNFSLPQFPYLSIGDCNSTWTESRAGEMTLCFEKQLAWKCMVNPWKIWVCWYCDSQGSFFPSLFSSVLINFLLLGFPSSGFLCFNPLPHR